MVYNTYYMYIYIISVLSNTACRRCAALSAVMLQWENAQFGHVRYDTCLDSPSGAGVSSFTERLLSWESILTGKCLGWAGRTETDRIILAGHWSLVTLFTVSTVWSKKDRVTSDQVCLESHTCHTKMVRPLCGRLWPYSCPKYHFWRKSRRKASFLSFAASFLEDVSQKSFVLELRSFIFEGSLAEKLGFWVWKLQFWMKSRRKASF